MRKIVGGAVLLILAVSLGGCAVTNAKSAPEASFQFTSAKKRLVVIEPDVQLGELTASGIFEPRADWTSSAKQLIVSNVGSILDGRGIEVIPVDNLTERRQIQLAKLHGVVGGAIVRHLYGNEKLPNKGSALDWTLGPGTVDFRDSYGADYALFLYVRDSYSTSGRVALMIGAALLGVGVPGGQQSAFASLVDLRSGDIVWFNTLHSGTGDLRSAEPAQKTVASLIGDMPL